MATTTYRPGAELRPLGLGELIDRTFTLYRNHFWLFCGVMVCAGVYSAFWLGLVDAVTGSARISDHEH